MIASLLTTALLASSPVELHEESRNLFAIRVGRAETASNGTIEHALILVENGKITAIGEDLPVERGIPVYDRPDWVATPGWVVCSSRVGMDSRGGGGFEPQALASDELYARQDVWGEVLDEGVTTLGLRAPGGGITGQAVAIKPHGSTVSEMIVADRVYLDLSMRANASAKKALRDAFDKVDQHDEKVQKAREKWEKEVEKAKKKKKSKKDDDKDKKAEDEEEAKGPGPFVAPEPDPKIAPFIALREGTLSGVVSIARGADYLHLLDVVEDEDFAWSIRCSLRDDIDLWELTEQIGEDQVRAILTSRVTLRAATRRERNIPAEFQRAGGKLALLPNSDSASGFAGWRHDVGHLVRAGLDRDAAIRAMTLEPAEVLGLGERLGSLDVDKDANILFWDGDPFEPATRIQAVMLEGDLVKGELR